MFDLLLPLAVISTATLSGLLGMGGGVILLAFYLLFLPVPEAMVLHGVTQLVSNGSRAWLLRADVVWGGLRRYLVGALAVLALLAGWQLVLSKPLLMILIGAAPLATTLCAGRLPALDFTRQALGCGALVTAAQLTAGVSGPLLDLFFLGGQLRRHQVVATKALTQTVGHSLKILYFGTLVSGAPLALPLHQPLLAVACAVIGTRIGKALLDRLSEQAFLGATRRLVLALSLLLVARGVAISLG